MNKLEWRLAFAKQYAKRRGDFLMGWILSRRAVELVKVRRILEKNNVFTASYSTGFPKVVSGPDGGAIFIA